MSRVLVVAGTCVLAILWLTCGGARPERELRPAGVHADPGRPTRPDRPPRVRERRVWVEAAPPGEPLPSEWAGECAITGVRGVQPGWVRVYVDFEARVRPRVELGVRCADPATQGSVRVARTRVDPAESEAIVDLVLDEDWMVANGFPSPCEVVGLDAVLRTKETQAQRCPSWDAEPFRMDVPFHLLHPGQVVIPAPGTATSVSVGLSLQRRHAAFPPRLLAVRTSEGRVGFVEVEELRGHDGTRSTVGLRAAAVFEGNDLWSEYGAGAEVFDGWGIDLDGLGVTRPTAGVEESHPGFETFPAGKELPAPPRFAESEYFALVLDNRGVPRCPQGGCLDLVYDEGAHVLRAANGAVVVSLDPGPITWPLVVPAPVTAEAALPPELVYRPGQLELATGAARELQPLSFRLTRREATELSAAAAPSSRVPAQRVELPDRRTPSPQEERIGEGVPKSDAGRADAFVGGGAATPLASIASFQACTGWGNAAFRCPTGADPLVVAGMPTAPGVGDGSERTILDVLAPYRAGRDNTQGTCLTHTRVEIFETLLNHWADAEGPRRVIVLDDLPIVVPTPRPAFSVSALLANLYTDLGRCVGAPSMLDERDGDHPFFVDAWWPARESSWRDWVDRAATPADGGAALDWCNGLTCATDAECPGVCDAGSCTDGGAACGRNRDCHGVCTDGGCLPACVRATDCDAAFQCRDGRCWQPCTHDAACPDHREHCRDGFCQPNDRYWSGFCIAQGQPAPGAYRNYSMMRVNEGEDPLADLPWSLVEHDIRMKVHERIDGNWATYEDSAEARGKVLAELDRGLPVELGYAPDGHDYATAGGTAALRQDPTWWFPPELGAASRDALDAAHGDSAGHAVAIVGYALDGPREDPDPYRSWFVLRNNWGKNGGHHSYYFMSFAAFALMTQSLHFYRLEFDCDDAACGGR